MHNVVKFLWALPTIVKIVQMISSLSLHNMILCLIMVLMCSYSKLTFYPTLRLLDGNVLPDVAKRANMILWV